MNISPIKFVKSIYNANKGNTSNYVQRVTINPDVPDKIYENVKPFLNGFDQLANKYDFIVDIRPLGNNRAAVTAANRIFFVENSEKGSDIARKLYAEVSDAFKSKINKK